MVQTSWIDDKALRVIEYSLEALILGWLSYLLIYQNYLLYDWHRGLHLPSRGSFVVLGIVIGGAFLTYRMLGLLMEGRKVSRSGDMMENEWQEGKDKDRGKVDP